MTSAAATGTSWVPGSAPVAVVMITLNEGHNLDAVLDNLKGWAQEVFVVDSYSRDGTVDIALRHGIHVVQRRFIGFGDQWNFAMTSLPIRADWTMKLDPDERVSPSLKESLAHLMRTPGTGGIEMFRRWWLLGRPLPTGDRVLRVWRTGRAAFSRVAVNEHPIVPGPTTRASGCLEHLDSPDLEHWIDKQNRYSSAEALSALRGDNLSAAPRLFGTALERRMWLKRIFYRVPGRYALLFAYFWLVRGLWKAGTVGYQSARLWTEVYRWKELKALEMRLSGQSSAPPREPRMYGPGHPDPRVPQY